MADAHDETLSERQESILRAVCRDYIVHGGEVSSKSLVGAHRFRCSSATLRQELATLERMGLVRRPHRSAGCSPTHRGLAHYVGALQSNASTRTPDVAVARAVDFSLRDLRHGPERNLRAAVCVLSEVSGCLAVTFVGGGHHDRVRTVDLVPLVGGRMLAVVEMEGGATHMHTVSLDVIGQPADPETIPVERLRAELRRLCAGRTLAEARVEVVREMSEREACVDQILTQALALGLVLCRAGPLDPLWLQMAGGPMLARGGVDAERLGDVLALLEDDQRLAEVLSQLVGEPGLEASPRAHVHVGTSALLRGSEGDARPEAGRAEPEGPTLTLVGCHVRLEQPAKRGAVALIGPDRMDYAAVIPLVEYAARALAATMDA